MRCLSRSVVLLSQGKQLYLRYLGTAVPKQYRFLMSDESLTLVPSSQRPYRMGSVEVRGMELNL